MSIQHVDNACIHTLVDKRLKYGGNISRWAGVNFRLDVSSIEEKAYASNLRLPLHILQCLQFSKVFSWVVDAAFAIPINVIRRYSVLPDVCCLAIPPHFGLCFLGTMNDALCFAFLWPSVEEPPTFRREGVESPRRKLLNVYVHSLCTFSDVGVHIERERNVTNTVCV